MPDTCYFDFIYEPITSFRKIIFEKLISKVNGQSVLDLGCGQVGHYWALAYQDKVEVIDFLDYHKSNTDILNRKITKLNPENIEKNFADTVQFLQEAGILKNLDYHTIALNLVSKVNNIEVFDFLKDTWHKQYDTILAVESLECVNSEEDFVLAINNTSKLLNSKNPDSKLLMLVLRYNLKDSYTQKLVEEKMEGKLNPTQTQLDKMFAKSLMKIDWIESVNVPELHNYPEAIFLKARLRN